MKKRYIALLVVCLVGIFICVYLGVSRFQAATGENTDLESLRDSLKQFETVPSETEPPILETEKSPISTDETGDETEPDPKAETAETESGDGGETVSETEAPEETKAPAQPAEPTLDFEPLKNLNPDIYAWIEIKDTKVDYPVLQNPYNDARYLTTAYDGSWYIGGSLFTQATYNGTDFNDPVTIIYGHTMQSGTLFGQLQSVYTDPVSFAAHDDIVIYLPGEVRHYAVFAAVPFDRYHILDTYDFTVEYWYGKFFDKVKKIRSFSACFNKELFPEFGDRVLILSTCLNEDSSRRFLVMAVCRDDLVDNNDGLS